MFAISRQRTLSTSVSIGRRFIHNNPLYKTQGLINGEWKDAANGSTFPVFNPATAEEIAVVPDMSVTETRQAISAASKTLQSWKQTNAKERSVLLRKWYNEIINHTEELAKLITSEQGKSLAEARGEVAYSASYVEWFAEEAKRMYGDTIPSTVPGRRLMVIKQPVGVCALITPWNFPIAMGARKIAPALAAGCTVVLKPSEDTPLSSLAVAQLAIKAGIPPGVINVVTSSRAGAASVGTELATSPLVNKISFTGSTAVGKLLLAQAAGTVKKVSMELGGNAPFIVFDDADLDIAVQGAVACKFRNSGQTCVSANRFLIQDGVYDKFAEKFAVAVKALKVGNGMEEGTNQGPLINVGAVSKVASHVEDAVAKGATVLAGGKNHALGGNFYEPTILTNVKNNMYLSNEETFGPVAPLTRFFTDDEAIKLANDTRAGLASYFYTKDLKRAWHVAEALESGMVGINEGVFSTEVAPFGGIKESGLGREGSKYGLEDYMEMKYVCWGQI